MGGIDTKAQESIMFTSLTKPVHKSRNANARPNDDKRYHHKDPKQIPFPVESGIRKQSNSRQWHYAHPANYQQFGHTKVLRQHFPLVAYIVALWTQRVNQKINYQVLPRPCIIEFPGAMAELADAEDLKSSGGNTLWVRPPLAP